MSIASSAFGFTALIASTSAVAAPFVNSDFERGEEGWRLKPAYSVRSGAGMNGSAGLVYENADPNLPYAFQKGTHGLKFETAWADVCKVGWEIRKYIPVLLSVEPAPVVSGVPDEWCTRVWRKDGETWLLAVNAQDAAGEATLALSEDFSAARAEFGPDAEKTGSRALRVYLAPNQPAFYRIR